MKGSESPHSEVNLLFQIPDRAVTETAFNYLNSKSKGPFWNQYFLNPQLSIYDLYFIFLIFSGLTLLRYFLSGVKSKRNSIIKCLSRRYSIARPGRTHKFSENVWYAIWHTCIFVWGLMCLMQEMGTLDNPGWPLLHLRNPDGRWYWMSSTKESIAGSVGWPLLKPEKLTRAFYLTQLAFWFSCVVFLNWETRRSDYYVIWVHHVVTIILIGFSYMCSYWKIGLIILLFHDIVDLCLYWAKALHNANVPYSLVDISFCIFVVCYFLARLVAFPYYCVFPSINSKVFREISNGLVKDNSDVPGGVALPLFLVVLMILHVYWFACIVRMTIDIIRSKRAGKSEYNDIRSGDELSDYESSTMNEKSRNCRKKD